MPTKRKLRVFVCHESKDRQFLDYFPTTQQTTAFDKLKASLRIRKDHLGI